MIEAKNLRKWKDIITSAISRLGGEAHLKEIYAECINICREIGRDTPPQVEATIRGTLEDNCPESARWKRVDRRFVMTRGAGKGYWGLLKDSSTSG